MDTVRFGKALGVGAREAARALLKAADAAAAPNPARPVTAPNPARPAPATPPRTPQAASPSSPESSGRTAARVAAQSAHQVRKTSREGGRLGKAVWSPVARLSGVVWLEVTGVFFGLFALTSGVEAWKLRADLRGPASAQQHVWLALAMLVVFGYFTVSSFIKASRRSRR